MTNNIVLADTTAEEAQKDFNLLLKDKFTLLVILGNDALADSAMKEAYKKINSGKKSYESVRAVHAKTPAYIKNMLEQLKLKPGQDPVDWNKISDYILLSISNKFNNIGRVITRAKFPDGPAGHVNLAVLYAQAADEKLN